MLSRIAENLFWMGRSIERVTNTISLLQATHLAVLEGGHLGVLPPHLWESLLAANQELESFENTQREINEKTVYEFLILSPENPSSVFRCIWNVRENLRSARNLLSQSLWLIVNEFYHTLQALKVEEILSLDRESFFRKARTFCLAFAGACDHTLLRDEVWYFLRMGRSLERAIQTAWLLEFNNVILQETIEGSSRAQHLHQWQILLRSVDGLEAYVQTYQNRILARNGAELLIRQTTFPRSILFNIQSLRGILEALPHYENSIPFWLLKQNVTGLESELQIHSMESLFKSGFGPFLQNILKCLLNLNGLISQAYFGMPTGKEEEISEERMEIVQ